MSEINIRKVAVIGCGFVGSASAFAIMQSGLFSEMVLIDANKTKAEGEALDISHGLPFAKPMKIYAGEYTDIEDASLIIVTAGAGQKPGETRLDLVKKNIKVFKSIIPRIAVHNKEAILLIVANPVDILTYVSAKLSGYPENRVFGTGTVLDTARLKTLIGEHLGVDPRTVHAFIIGEHGDSEIAAWNSANVSGVPLGDFCEMRGHFDHDEAMKKLAEDVKNSAYEIIEKKSATYYGIAMSVKRICEAIVRDEKSILPVSSIHHGNYGIDDIALSLPVIVGKDGIETAVPINLSQNEAKDLKKSAETVKAVLEEAFLAEDDDDEVVDYDDDNGGEEEIGMKYHVIDARNTSGNFFAKIREQMNGISSNTGIELIQSFEPQAMYDLMSGMGYEHRTEKRKKGEYHIYFFKKEQHKD